MADTKLLIGEKTRGTVNLLKGQQRTAFYDQVGLREFFLCVTEKIINYLSAFDNVIGLLRNLRFLQQSSKSSAKLEKYVNVAQTMPAIVHDEYDALRLEVREYKTETKIKMDDTLAVNKYW